MLKQSTIHRLFLFGLAILLFAGCSPRKIGHGVVLWSHDENELKTGSYVWVIRSSKLRSTYTVMTPEDREEIELDQWRIKFSEKENAAKEAQKAYEPYISYFASSDRAGHYVRDTANAGANRVYRLRNRQEVKLLNRTENKQKIGSWNEYWFQILTEDGYTGWSYGSYLTPFSIDINAAAIVEEEEENPLVTNFFSNVWRPEYFDTMITKDTIDLESFRRDYGFFPDRGAKKVHLKTRDHSVTIDFTEMAKLGYNHYILSGSTMNVRFRGDDAISVQYNYQGREYADTFVLLETDLEETILKEKTRREIALNAIAGGGNLLKSTAYGSIKLDKSGYFIWSSFDRLVPEVIPSGIAGTGVIRFDHFLGTQVKQNFQGVITFSFDKISGREDLHFLYSTTGSGIQLEFVPPKYIKNKVVTQANLSPTTLYFNYLQN